jgi:succinate-semialdehyde dehydrogenase/glutarate-semialdehyde dehydrogenase
VTIATTNPATGEVLETFDPMFEGQIDRILDRAAFAFDGYRETDLDQRADWMLAAAKILEDERDDLAAVMTTEMGKTIQAARAEVDKCAAACRFFATHAAAYLADEPADGAGLGAEGAYVRYEPLGPVLAVMPWNFPLWQVIRFAAPGLMSGNVGLLKHASNVPRTALRIEDLFRRAGFPDGVFQTLLIGSETVERVLRDPRVHAATITGSEPAGRSIASIAGSEIKPTVLELGGSDPFVVTASADIERAAKVAVVARVQNNGQSCIAAKRFIVDAAVANDFEERFVAGMEALSVGDPFDEGTDVGPLVSERALLDVEAQVADAIDKGAAVLAGGARVDRPGWFYAPSVVAGVTPEMRMFHEEVFAPVASLYRVDGPDEAIALANATTFGLGSNVWTRESAERDRFVRGLQAGQVFVNGMVTSMPPLPFGGVKRSGYGRELSAQGIRAFCNVKTVWVGSGSDEASVSRSE